MTEKEFLEMDSSRIDLKSIFVKYLPYWYWFLVSGVVCIAGAFVYLKYYSTPIYRISSTIQLKGAEKDDNSAEKVPVSGLGNFQSGSVIDDEVDILKSHSLMLRVLKELSLHVRYQVEGRLKNKEVYGDDLPIFVVFSSVDSAILYKTESFNLYLKDDRTFDLEEEHGRRTTYRLGQEIQKPFGAFKVMAGPRLSDHINDRILVNFNDVTGLASGYSNALTVEISNKKNVDAKIINISLLESVPTKGVDIINKLVELYNKEAVEDKNLLTLNSIQFIDDRLRLLTSELSEVEKGVEVYKRQNEVTNISSEASIYLENSSDYTKRLSQLEIEMEVLSSIEDLLSRNTENGDFNVIPGSLSIQDPTLLSLIGRYNELQVERERMLRTVQPNNPLVHNITEQLVYHKRNILDGIKNTKNQIDITHRNIKESSGDFASRIEKVPQIERELLEVMRQQGIKQELYLYLLQKREESALSLAAAIVSSARVIDPAMAGSSPISPDKKKIYLFAFGLGMGLPFALIYLKKAVQDQVENQSDIGKLTATPILGDIPHNKVADVLVMAEDVAMPLAEHFRHIRANLQFKLRNKEDKVILVTSSISGEGKTFFAINLAASLALTGKRTVVLDFDLRMPSLLQDLGMKCNSGVTDFLRSTDISLDEIVLPSPIISNLYLIGAGAIPRNPAEFLMSQRLSQLFMMLEEQFDYVVLDTAPVGPVADAFSLAPYVDATVFLVRSNFTNKGLIKIINDIYVNKKFNSPMIVLNDTQAHSLGYGYGYGYSYGGSKPRFQKYKESFSQEQIQ